MTADRRIEQAGGRVKLLFLDIDGVLNSEAWYRARPEGPWSEDREIDPEALWLLQALVGLTSCKVVISSSWRIGRELHELERLLPFIPLVGKTPVSSTAKTRGAEIRQYLATRTDVEAYAILDDNSDFYDDQPLVRTEWKLGLRPRHCWRVAALLNAASTPIVSRYEHESGDCSPGP